MTAHGPRPRDEVLELMLLEVVTIMRSLRDRGLTLRLEPLWEEYLAASAVGEERERHMRLAERLERRDLTVVGGGRT